MPHVLEPSIFSKNRLIASACCTCDAGCDDHEDHDVKENIKGDPKLIVGVEEVGEETMNINAILVNMSENVLEGVKMIEDLREQADLVAQINLETNKTTEKLHESITDVQRITADILKEEPILALQYGVTEGYAPLIDELTKLAKERYGVGSDNEPRFSRIS